MNEQNEQVVGFYLHKGSSAVGRSDSNGAGKAYPLLHLEIKIMIRKFQPSDMDAVIKIWLDASIAAHYFVDAAYWQSKKEDMKNIYLPSSTTHLYESAGEILGFISMAGSFIAALFVSPEAQGKGIGTQLMDFVKQTYNSLELAVYKENTRSVRFYQKQGFHVTREAVEEHTGHVELIMKFEFDAEINRVQSHEENLVPSNYNDKNTW